MHTQTPTHAHTHKGKAIGTGNALELLLRSAHVGRPVVEADEGAEEQPALDAKMRLCLGGAEAALFLLLGLRRPLDFLRVAAASQAEFSQIEQLTLPYADRARQRAIVTRSIGLASADAPQTQPAPDPTAHCTADRCGGLQSSAASIRRRITQKLIVNNYTQ